MDLNTVSDWIEKHKPWAQAMFVVLAMSLSFLGGYYNGISHHPTIQEHIQEHTATKTQIDTKTQVVDNQKVDEQKNQDKQKDVVVVVTKISKPDGTVIERTKTENKEHTQTEAKKETQSQEVKTVVQTKVEYVDRVVKVDKLINVPQPKWLVGATVGTGLNFVPVYGLTVDYNVIGPFYLGVWGGSDFKAGLALKFRF